MYTQDKDLVKIDKHTYYQMLMRERGKGRKEGERGGREGGGEGREGGREGS